jgi:hypothetical protein
MYDASKAATLLFVASRLRPLEVTSTQSLGEGAITGTLAWVEKSRFPSGAC